MSSAAFADGMVSLKDTPVAAPATWAGPYFGMSIGYGHNDSKNNYSDSSGERSSRDESADGGLVSLVWGVDCMLRDRVVVGGFIDFDWSDINRGHDENSMTIDRSFQIGGRLGYLLTQRTMVFATAGYSRAHFDNEGWWDIDAGGSTFPGEDSNWYNGYFVGVGLESRIGGNFFLRGEARYADYSSEHTNVGTAFGTSYVDSEDPEIWTGRLGIIYKLGAGEVPFRENYGQTDGNLKIATYYGVDVAKDIWAIYSGGVMALNGDLTRDGFVARSFGYYADYSFDQSGTSFDGTDRALDVMLGYQKYFGTVSAVGYIGMEVRDIDNSPSDPSSSLEGTQTGFKVATEIETEDENSPFYGSLDASYSTAFNSWYAQLRAGPNFKRIKVGPEGTLYSDEGEVTTRVGAFAIIPFSLRSTMPAELSFSAGYQFVEGSDNNNNGNTDTVRGGEGGYFGSMFKVLF
jgi:opacity protein-like surface antigen